MPDPAQPHPARRVSPTANHERCVRLARNAMRALRGTPWTGTVAEFLRTTARLDPDGAGIRRDTVYRNEDIYQLYCRAGGTRHGRRRTAQLPSRTQQVQRITRGDVLDLHAIELPRPGDARVAIVRRLYHSPMTRLELAALSEALMQRLLNEMERAHRDTDEEYLQQVELWKTQRLE